MISKGGLKFAYFVFDACWFFRFSPMVPEKKDPLIRETFLGSYRGLTMQRGIDELSSSFNL